LSPQRIVDSDVALSWEIEDEILSQSLQELHNEMLRGRDRVNAQTTWAYSSDLELMCVVCRGESNIRGGPYLRTEKERLTLELECCRLVTTPALTGLVMTLEVYGMSTCISPTPYPIGPCRLLCSYTSRKACLTEAIVHSDRTTNPLT
jgi:hypothetical protein